MVSLALMGKDAPGFKRCPACEEPVADWRSQCDCGHVFFVREEIEGRRVKKKVRKVQKSPDDLENLIDAVQRPPKASESGGCLWILALAGVVIVLIGIVSYPLETIALCAVVLVLVVALRAR
ncbi:MAG: hypothetical protein SFV15_26630 [Polyangiaceae bacterium]|nr:hypothetical protein [Polyangiaceae bacterium]